MCRWRWARIYRTKWWIRKKENEEKNEEKNDENDEKNEEHEENEEHEDKNDEHDEENEENEEEEPSKSNENQHQEQSKQNLKNKNNKNKSNSKKNNNNKPKNITKNKKQIFSNRNNNNKIIKIENQKPQKNKFHLYYSPKFDFAKKKHKKVEQTTTPDDLFAKALEKSKFKNIKKPEHNQEGDTVSTKVVDILYDKYIGKNGNKVKNLDVISKQGLHSNIPYYILDNIYLLFLNWL